MSNIKTEVIETTAVEVIKPETYGLTKENLTGLNTALSPILAKREELIKQYKQMIGVEITPEVIKQSKKVRLALVKNRTEQATAIKGEKDYSLQYGKLCDALKKKEAGINSRMESDLKIIEEHEATLRAERVTKLAESRAVELEKYKAEAPAGLGEMTPDFWTIYLTGIVANHENEIKAQKLAKKKAELKTERNDIMSDLKHFCEFDGLVEDMDEKTFKTMIKKAEKGKKCYHLNTQRKKELGNVLKFVTKEQQEIDYGVLTEKEYLEILDNATKLKKEDDQKQAKIEAENKRLKKKLEKAEADKKIRDKADKEKREKDAQIESDRLQKIQDGLNADDSEKMQSLFDDLEALKTKYVFKSEASKYVLSTMCGLIDKTVTHCKDKLKNIK